MTDESEDDQLIRSELGRPGQVFSSELDRAIYEVEVRFPDSYGGCVGESDGTETVFAVRSGLKQIADALEADVGPPDAARYRVIPVEHSLAELGSLRDKVTHDDGIEAAAIKLASWGPDPRSNTVLVKVLGDPSAARRYLEERYGRGLFTVLHTPYRTQRL